MLNTIIIAGDISNGLENFKKYLENNLCKEIKNLNTPQLILNAIKNKSILLIIKQDSLNFDSVELVKKVIKTNAFTNIALLSNNSPEELEKKFEGFGILIQLSDPPIEHEVKTLCNKFTV